MYDSAERTQTNTRQHASSHQTPQNYSRPAQMFFSQSLRQGPGGYKYKLRVREPDLSDLFIFIILRCEGSAGTNFNSRQTAEPRVLMI